MTDPFVHLSLTSKTTQSGLFGTGGAGFTIGSRMNSTDQQGSATTAAGSTLGSLAGDVTLLAGEHYRQVGSDVLAPGRSLTGSGGNITLAARQIDIEEARQTSREHIEQKFKQSGLTVSVSSPVITALQTAGQMNRAARDTSDTRMKALAAASIALAVLIFTLV